MAKVVWTWQGVQVSHLPAWLWFGQWQAALGTAPAGLHCPEAGWEGTAGRIQALGIQVGEELHRTEPTHGAELTGALPNHPPRPMHTRSAEPKDSSSRSQQEAGGSWMLEPGRGRGAGGRD